MIFQSLFSEISPVRRFNRNENVSLTKTFRSSCFPILWHPEKFRWIKFSFTNSGNISSAECCLLFPISSWGKTLRRKINFYASARQFCWAERNFKNFMTKVRKRRNCVWTRAFSFAFGRNFLVGLQTSTWNFFYCFNFWTRIENSFLCFLSMVVISRSWFFHLPAFLMKIGSFACCFKRS